MTKTAGYSDFLLGLWLCKENEVVPKSVIRKFKNENWMLDYLFNLTMKEFNGESLTASEEAEYVRIAEFCHSHNLEIPFGISM